MTEPNSIVFQNPLKKSMTPQRTLSASATPAPATDAINKQAQHILALNETESALKGFYSFFDQLL